MHCGQLGRRLFQELKCKVSGFGEVSGLYLKPASHLRPPGILERPLDNLQVVSDWVPTVHCCIHHPELEVVSSLN